jgi:hypothetical protein
VTKVAARSWSALFDIGHDFSACQVKPGLRNGRSYTATLSCAGGKASGKSNFNVTSTSLNGEVNVIAHEPSYDRLDTKIVQARWLGSNCDDNTQVRPRP